MQERRLQHGSRSLADLMSEVEKAVQRAEAGFTRPLWGTVAGPSFPLGSRVQPRILLLASECAGGATVRSVSLAVAVELIHTALFVHDGVRDDGAAPPGGDGTWQRKAPVLRGDYLLANAVGTLAAGGNMSFLSDLMRAFAEMCEGQARFLQARGGVLEVHEYLEALRMRAGALTAFSARAGVLAADGPPEYAEAFRAFGESFGVAYALAGEIEDLLKDRQRGVERVLAPDRWLTLPIALTAQAGEGERATLEALLAKGSFLPDELAEVRRLAEGSGAVSRCWEMVGDWLASALDHLLAIPETPAKDALVQTATDLCGDHRDQTAGRARLARG